MRSDNIEVRGCLVKEALPGYKFIVVPPDNVKIDKIICRLSGNLRRFKIHIIEGDIVTVSVSPYDLTNGFIIYRE